MAPFDIGTLQIRNPVLPFQVRADIEGYTLITYEIDPQKLAPRVPLPLHTRLVDGREVAYLSLFLGHLKVRRIGALPAFPLAFNQLNYRTYVRHGAAHAIFIFRTVVSHEFVARGVRLFPHLPGQAQPFAFVVDRRGAEIRRIEAIVGERGSELMAKVEPAEAVPRANGFRDLSEAKAFLADVPEAFYLVDDRTLGRMVSFHPPIEPQGGNLIEIRCGWLERQGIVPDGGFGSPQSVWLQALVPFPVFI